MNKARSRVAFENNGNALRVCADRTLIWKSRGVVDLTCLSGRSYLSPGDRSVVLSPL